MLKSLSRSKAGVDLINNAKFMEKQLLTSACNTITNHHWIQTKSWHLSPSYNRRRKKMTDDNRFTVIGEYKIFPWATSGLESSIVVQGPGSKDRMVFDMGYAHREAVKCSDVFISHGHIDHVAGIPHHSAKRSLASCKPKPTYYIPSHLQDPLTKVFEAFSAMNEEKKLDYYNLQPIDAGTTVKISGDRFIRAFPTFHRVRSQGYIMSKRRWKLKPEYQGLAGPEIGQLVKDGVDIREEKTTPEVAYTGDSTFEVFQNCPDPDLLRVKILITESTYIDDEIDQEGRGGQQRARERGHMHIQEFIDNAGLFEAIDKIVLLHFSDKYSIGYLRDKTEALLEGSPLKDKIIIGSIMKEVFPK